MLPPEITIAAIKSEIVKDPMDLTLWELLKEEIKTSKAVWTTAYVNLLPDEAFGLILSGGEKDEEGKTVPRSLRKLPHHDSSVKDPMDDNSVDWPHLLNSLARISQVEGATDAQIKQAQEHLQGHFDRIKIEAGEENNL